MVWVGRRKYMRKPAGGSQGLQVTPCGRKQGCPEGWPAVMAYGESLWDFVLQPPREAPGVAE